MKTTPRPHNAANPAGFADFTNLARFPRAPLGLFPTPVVELKRLSERLGGPRILMKRDDQSGLALGGNKVRKLEFLIGEALAQGCDSVVTGGAAQSNHCRQTAAAAAASGLACHLALGGEPPVGAAPGSYAAAVPGGNLLLDLLFGAEIHWCGRFRKGERIPEIMAEIRGRGGKPYLIPYGGSNPVGALGFAAAVGEIAVGELTTGEAAAGETAASDATEGESAPDGRIPPREWADLTRIVFASSSGGTHAGLMVGKDLYGLKAELVGIAIDKGEAGEGPFDEHVARLAAETAALIGLTENRYTAADVILENGYTGAGYGVVGDLERRAIGLLARTEGILVDPVYTGRAFGALIDMIERGKLTRSDTVLFWHTGGTPALFSCAAEILGGPGIRL